MRGDMCEWDHGADPVVLEDAALSRVLAPHLPPAHLPPPLPLPVPVPGESDQSIFIYFICLTMI